MYIMDKIGAIRVRRKFRHFCILAPTRLGDLAGITASYCMTKGELRGAHWPPKGSVIAL